MNMIIILILAIQFFEVQDHIVGEILVSPSGELLISEENTKTTDKQIWNLVVAGSEVESKKTAFVLPKGTRTFSNLPTFWLSDDSLCTVAKGVDGIWRAFASSDVKAVTNCLRFRQINFQECDHAFFPQVVDFGNEICCPYVMESTVYMHILSMEGSTKTTMSLGAYRRGNVYKVVGKTLNSEWVVALGKAGEYADHYLIANATKETRELKVAGNYDTLAFWPSADIIVCGDWMNWQGEENDYILQDVKSGAHVGQLNRVVWLAQRPSYGTLLVLQNVGNETRLMELVNVDKSSWKTILTGVELISSGESGMALLKDQSGYSILNLRDYERRHIADPTLVVR